MFENIASVCGETRRNSVLVERFPGDTNLSLSRRRLTSIAGWICVLVAVFLVSFAGVMLTIGTRPIDCLKTASTSLFPALVAVACLWPSKRTIALRLIGGVICLACIGTFVFLFVNPPNDDVPIRRGTLLLIAVAGGAMAIKGKWPGADSANSSVAARSDRVSGNR